MNKNIDRAFEKFNDCMKLFEKGMKQIFKSKIYATLSDDVEAIVKTNQ